MRRGAWTLFVALGLHATLMFLPGRREVPFGAGGEADPIAVELVADPAPSVEVEREITTGVATAGTPKGIPGRGALVGKGEATGEGASGEQGNATAVESPGGASPPEGMGAPGVSLSQLGLDGKNAFLGKELVPPPDPARELERSMRREQDQHDKEIGLDPSGPVVASLEEAIRGGTAPIEGIARFLVKVDGSGQVLDVRVVSANGGREALEEAAKVAKKALEGKPIPRTGPRGVAMLVELESRFQLPNGAAPGVSVRVFGKKVSKGSDRATPINVLPLVTMLRLVDGGPPIPLPDFTIIGAAPDPANIGAQGIRVVRGHLVDIERF